MDNNFNIYKLIKKEKKNINSVNFNNLYKVFNKFIFKFSINIKENLYKINNKNDLYCSNIKNINNLLFEIFWIIFLGCYNQQVTLFFLERASILFTEFISLAIKIEIIKLQIQILFMMVYYLLLIKQSVIQQFKIY